VLPRGYARPSLDKVRLGGLVDIISNIGFNESAAKSKDMLGRVYEYFLGKFASAEGKGGGEFYTPQCVVQVLAAMLEPTFLNYVGERRNNCYTKWQKFARSNV
jgi:type I restriction enzyme M protein